MTHEPSFVGEELLGELCESFRLNTRIPPELFSRYGIKRGLRNSDGTGVLVGMSRLGNVHGYIMNEGEREPIEGRLTYRGYNVYDLIRGLELENRFGFEEVGYLLMCGSLPTRRQLADFQHTIGLERALPENFTEDMIMRAPSRDIMNKLAAATLALYSYDANPDETTVENIMRQGISLTAKFPVIISHAYQAKRRYFDGDSMFLHVPDPDRSTAENILHLIRPDGQYTDEEAKLLDRCLILHAEHGGGNNSTFTVRVTSSSGTDTYSAISAAVSSLKGPRHGGANLRVVSQFDEIKQNVSNWKDEEEVRAYLAKILDGEAGDGSGLIYGMGHAIYTKSDPRAVALKDAARPLAEQKGFTDEMDLLELIERITPGVFAEKKGDVKPMCANVDMYSGFVYKMLGLPRSLYTPLFATARIVGWMAHRLEEVSTGGKIMRPAFKPLSKSAEYRYLAERG
ncbi:citrate/2-methylcitrate synthase [Butyricicoccus faecihominis]|uniref:citrate/2-methylcitrate synthase n=1 Tax=Butyricicoccaceae TaxID=3085642 RepID=UPI0024786911|nr:MULTISPECIES: citrate/2-methylcitrate synthase [Butyricicoccaceae]MCQ5130471.1 citrate/2-methylcitrate synthase [Butyricicoccus faecihominis]WNX84882.1 citrate/2-methylcitrate synthase [Agathobaculum sp. NTUH-O15-33]